MYVSLAPKTSDSPTFLMVVGSSLEDFSWLCTHIASRAVILFSELYNVFFGYFGPANTFLDNETESFPG